MSVYKQTPSINVRICILGCHWLLVDGATLPKEIYVGTYVPVGSLIMIVKDGILCKAESPKKKEFWTLTTVHTNGTIRVTGRTKLECLNVQRVEPYFENA